MRREKTGGRREGTPNKITKEVREVLNLALANEIHLIPQLLSQIKSPEKRLDAIAKLLPFALPRYTPIGAAVDMNRTIIVRVPDDDEEDRD